MSLFDNLTQSQKIAIEGEVAKVLSSARHDADILFRFYVMLKESPIEVVPLIREVVRDLTSIDQEVLDKVAMEAKVDTTPVWLWIDRVVADIKLGLSLAANAYIGSASMNIKGIQQKAIKSAFVYFCRECSIVSPSAVKELCIYILNNATIDLDFLTDVCFSMLEQIKQLPLDKTVKFDLLNHSLDLRNTLSYNLETEILNKLKNAPLDVETVEEAANEFKEKLKKPKAIKSEKMDEIVSSTLSEILKSKAIKKGEEWAVVKQYRDYETTIRTFKDEETADNYIKKIEGQFPELKGSCKFLKKKII